MPNTAKYFDLNELHKLANRELARRTPNFPDGEIQIQYNGKIYNVFFEKVECDGWRLTGNEKVG